MSLDHTKLSLFAIGLRDDYEKKSKQHSFLPAEQAASAEKARRHKLTRHAIETLETQIIPLLQAAKAQIEPTGPDVIVSRNWNLEGACLDEPTARFQCASKIAIQSAGGLPLCSKVASFWVDQGEIKYGFEGADIKTRLTNYPDNFPSIDNLVDWAVEEVVSNYYYELAKATYLMPR